MTTATTLPAKSNGHRPVPSPQAAAANGLMARLRPQLEVAVPKSIGLERFARVALTTLRGNDEIAACTEASVLGALMLSAQLGLEVGPHLGHAYLVPFKKNRKLPTGAWETTKECTLIIGYKGLLELVRRSGQISGISAEVVYGGDLWEYQLGDQPRINHQPAMRTAAPKDEAILAAYAVAQFRDGSIARIVMQRWEIDRIRASSKSGNSGPWVEHFAEMAKKTALRRLCKYLPLSAEIREAVEMEEAKEEGRAFVSPTFQSEAEQEAELLAEPVAPTRTAALKDSLKAGEAAEPGPAGAAASDQSPPDPAPKPSPRKGRTEALTRLETASKKADIKASIVVALIQHRHGLKVKNPSDATDEVLTSMAVLVEDSEALSQAIDEMQQAAQSEQSS